ncbi:hypothetical protein M1328_05025 [Patescibacteria group bacterium]|nr:hypothetical protein [Patescibacteria group bacterium]
MRKIIIILLLFGAAIFIFRFIVGGPEDDWICVNGNWVKHGRPNLPKPTGICSKIK